MFPSPGKSQASPLENVVRQIACSDLGPCACQRVVARQPYCHRSSRGLRPWLIALSQRRTMAEVEKLVTGGDRIDLRAEKQVRQLKRQEASYWWGDDIDDGLAACLSEFCYKRNICAHDIRLLVNTGVIQVNNSSGRPLQMRSLWRQYYDLLTQAIFGLMVLILSLSIWICPLPIEVSTMLLSISLALVSIALFLNCLRLPAILLITSKRLRGLIAEFSGNGDVPGTQVTSIQRIHG